MLREELKKEQMDFFLEVTEKSLKYGNSLMSRDQENEGT